MTRFRRLAMVAALATVVVVAMPIPVHACACAPVVAVPEQPPRPVSFDREVAIFSAIVVEMSFLKETVTLDVLKVWKGELTYLTTMRILSGDNCEWTFEMGKAYLIFGVGDSIATMRAYKCTLTAGLEDANETIKLLEEAGYRPRQPQLR